MRRTWPLWIAGLLLKLLGASWDVSWHFKLLFDTWSPAHLTNVAGFVLIAVAFLLDWRARTSRDQAALNVTGAGFALFLLAIPLDQWWHLTFGLDLTTWSPTHLMLFGGTSLTIAGLGLLALSDLGWEPRAPFPAWTPAQLLFLGTIAFFFVEAVMFPLTFNEYAAVASWNIAHGFPLYVPSVEIQTFASGVAETAYGGLPHALYPTYAIGATVLVAMLFTKIVRRPGFATLVLAAYAIERALANLVLASGGWPTSATPWHVIAIALAVELASMAATSRVLRALFVAGVSVVVGDLWFASSSGWMVSVPFDPAVIGWTCVGALVGATLAELVHRVPDRAIVLAGEDPAPPVMRVAARIREAWAR